MAVNLTLADANQLRRDVQNAVRWAAWGHRIEIPIGLRDPNSLRNDVQAAVRRAQTNQTIRIRVRADTSDLNNLRRTLNGGGNGRPGSRSGGADFGLKSLLLLAPAALPLTAGLAAQLSSLSTQIGAAGIATTAYGVALAGQIKDLSDAADAQQKYRDAVAENGAASQEAAEAAVAYQRTIAKMPADTQRAAIALAGLKDNFHTWSDDMAQFTMKPVTDGVAILDNLLPRLTPEVQSASTQLGRLTAVAGGAFASPGFDRFADRVASFTDRKLDELTDEVIHLMRVLSSGGGGNGFIEAFVDYARANGPAAKEALKQIAQAVMVLVEGAAQAGPGLLTLVTAAARLVAALPPELVGIILHVAAALKLLQLSGAGFAALAGGIGRIRTQIAALSTASTAAGGGLAGLRAAFMALGTAARASVVVAGLAALVVVLTQISEMGKEAPPDVDKLTTSLGQLGRTGKVVGEASRAFGKNLGDLHDKVSALTDPSTTDKVQQWIVTLGGIGKWNSTPVKEAKEYFGSIDDALSNLVKNGQADLAAAALKRLTADYVKGGHKASEFTGHLDKYKAALADQRFEQDLTADSMGLFGKAAQETSTKLDAQKQSADGLRASIIALNETNRSAYDAQIGFEQAVDDLSAAFKKNGATLNLNTQAGRDNGQAMSAAAKSQDEMIAAGLAAGESLASMTGKSSKLRAEMVRLATEAFDGNKKKAREYVNTLLGTPEQIKTIIKLERQEAVAGLKEVQAEIVKTPDAKSIVVSTLNAAAIRALEAVGLKTKQLPDGRTQVFTANGQSLGSIDAVRRALAALDGKRADTYTTNHVLTIRETRAVYNTVGRPSSGEGGVSKYADGGIRFFADGAENHVAQIAAAGSWRVWGEPETGGESYIPLSPGKRPRSRRIAEETVRRLGGDPRAIQWNADGSVTDWRYDPQTGSLYSPSDAGQAGHKTKKVKGKEVDYFSLSAVEAKIKSTAKATLAWDKDLERVADRVGGDVADALASMGADGVALAHKMATGSTKYINDMAAALRNLQTVAKASLSDYTRQLGKANTVNQTFFNNLAKLAGQGYGDLAAQLAAQNDTAAQQLAAAAVKDKTKAAAANKTVKAANSALTSDQAASLVQIIAAITSSKVGIHSVAASTGLGEDDIITVATKAKSQISSSLGSRATKFLADLGRANQHLSYANGGIRSGIYATQGGLVRFAEPETHGEAYLPLSPTKRRNALPVLADVAHRFGLGLTNASAGRPVVIVRSGDTTHVSVTPVRTGATASDIGSQVGRSVRRARRGGVAARAA